MSHDSLQPQACDLVHQYTHLTGREARIQVYEHALFDFFRVGFTVDEFVTVLAFLIRENKRNRFQYSIKLGHLINDHSKFMDYLGEAKAVNRNTVKPPSPKQEILHAFRGITPERAGNCVPIKEVFEKLREATS